MRVLKSCAGALLASCLAVSPLAAQSAQRLSVQVSGLYAALHGGDYEEYDISNGYGGEAQIRFTPGIFSLGAGFQYTLHTSPGESADLGGGIQLNVEEWDVHLFGFFLEPRLVIPVGSSAFAPYISGRFSILQYKDDTNWSANTGERGTVSSTTRGLTFNGGGGILVRLGQRINLDLGATYGYSNFDDYTVTFTGPGFSESQVVTAGSGQNIVVRAGLAIGLGG